MPPIEDVFVVGDTNRDYDCARAAGLRSVLVATGGGRYEDLAALRPDLLFRSFEDVEDSVRRLSAPVSPLTSGGAGCV